MRILLGKDPCQLFVHRRPVDVATPAAGTVCEQDVVPFAQPSLTAASSPEALAAGRQFRALLFPEAVIRAMR